MDTPFLFLATTRWVDEAVAAAAAAAVEEEGQEAAVPIGSLVVATCPVLGVTSTAGLPRRWCFVFSTPPAL